MAPDPKERATATQRPACGDMQVDNRLFLQRAINDKDRLAFAKLYTRYYPALVHYIVTRVGGATDVEDWAQDVFVQLWRTRARYELGVSVEAYLFAVANRVIAWHMRRRKRRQRHAVTDQIVDSIVVYQRSTGPDLIDQILSVLYEGCTKKTGSRLSPKSREAIRLLFFQGLPVREAADKAGCSVPAFYSRLERGLRLLRQTARGNS